MPGTSAPVPLDPDVFKWNLLQRKAQESRLLTAFSLFRSQGIEPILIKGYAAGLYYPPDEVRLSIDTDIAVSSADYETSHAIAVSAETEGLAIDLHRELRHLDTSSWQDLVSRSQLVSVDDGNIRTLSAEDHLRVICVHWLTDGGSNKGRLWDIYHMVENRPADFAWDLFMDPAPPHRRRWLACAIGLAHKYLGLSLDGIPFADEARSLPAWLIQTVEAEWEDPTPYRPLESSITDRKQFMLQLGKRLRPNPIWATVEANGSFDAKTRIGYQLRSLIVRAAPSFRNVTAALKRRLPQ